MPDPGVQVLQRSFGVLNPHGGLNPHGNCTGCADRTARVLSNGTAPTQVTVAVADLTNYDGDEIEFDPIPGRSRTVFAWLIQARPGVYVVDADDHAYNFVKTTTQAIYLVDSNQHVFRRVRSLADLVAVGHNATVEDRYPFNYANPGDEDGDWEMKIIHFGNLSPLWNARLTGMTFAGGSATLD